MSCLNFFFIYLVLSSLLSILDILFSIKYDKTKSIFEGFLKKHMGKSLPTKIIDESFSNLTITSDPITNSVLTFAERADSLGYLGRTGYNLDGIFYQPDLNLNEMVEELNG